MFLCVESIPKFHEAVECYNRNTELYVKCLNLYTQLRVKYATVVDGGVVLAKCRLYYSDGLKALDETFQWLGEVVNSVASTDFIYFSTLIDEYPNHVERLNQLCANIGWDYSMNYKEEDYVCC